jgi:hypothetical protein
MRIFMKIKVNTYVYCRILLSEQMQINKKHLVHPEDQHLINNDLHFGLLKCASIENGYYCFIGKNGFKIRTLKGAVSKIMPSPQFDFEEEIVDLTKPEKTKMIIYDIDFHLARNEYMYFVKVNGKKKSRRYFADEIGKIDTILSQ